MARTQTSSFNIDWTYPRLTKNKSRGGFVANGMVKRYFLLSETVFNP